VTEQLEEGFELTGSEILLLALSTANFSATLLVLEIMARAGLVAEDELKTLHEGMSAAIDAAAAAAPLALVVRTQTMIDLAIVRLRDEVRSPTS
jgi:hypothetical protein